MNWLEFEVKGQGHSEVKAYTLGGIFLPISGMQWRIYRGDLTAACIFLSDYSSVILGVDKNIVSV